MKRLSFAFVASITLFASLTPADAAISIFTLAYGGQYEQTSSAPPASAVVFTASTGISTPINGEATAGTLQTPLSTWNMQFVPDQGLALIHVIAASESALLAGAPLGNYNYTVTAGFQAGWTGRIRVLGFDFPVQVPALKPASWTALQLCPAGVSVPITWNTFTTPGVLPNQNTNFGMYNYTEGTVPVFVGGTNPGFGGTTIPGSVLKSGHRYQGFLQFFTYQDTPNAGSGSVTSRLQFIRDTQIPFKVKAERGTISGQLIFQGSTKQQGVKVSAEVVEPGGTVVDSVTFISGTEGWYAFDTSYRGVCRVRFDADHYLSVLSSTVDTNVGQDFYDATLLNGDVDDDNEVTILDYIHLSSNFGAESTNPNWLNLQPNGLTPQDADLDEDGEITILDYILLSTNYGLSGT
jgi:hypothetical protein